MQKNEGKTWLTSKTPQNRVRAEITVNIKYFRPAKVVAGVSPHKNYVSKLEKSVVRKGGKDGCQQELANMYHVSPWSLWRGGILCGVVGKRDKGGPSDWYICCRGGRFSKEGGKIRQGLYRRIRGRDYPKGCFKYRHSTIENSANMEPDSKYGWRQLGRGGKCATIIIIKTLQMVVLWWWFLLMRHLPGNQHFLYFSVFTYDKPRCGVHQFNAWKG